jgi:hypothetical protein
MIGCMKCHFGSNGRSVCSGPTRPISGVSVEWSAVTCVSCRRWVERYRGTGNFGEYFRARTGALLPR